MAEGLIWIIHPAAVNIHTEVLVVLRLSVLLPALRRQADAVRVGLTTALVLANKLHRKDAITCQPQAAGQDFTGTLLPALAVLAVQPQRPAQEPAVVQDHAPLDLIG